MQDKTFSEVITFTRSTTGTWLNPASGFLETAAINAPRIESNGLLFEPQRVNVALQSNDFSNAAWSKNGTSVGASVTSPDGSVNAAKMVESAANAVHNFSQAGKVVSGNTKYCRSVFAKADANGRFLYLDTSSFANWANTGSVTFDLVNGSILNPTVTLDGYGIEPWGNGWYRCWLVSTTVAAPAAVPFTLFVTQGGSTTYTGDGTSGIYVFGAQFEAGGAPSSYIPTAAAQATRAADIASVPDQIWLRSAEGTLFAEVIHGLPLNCYAAALVGPVANARIGLWTTSASRFASGIVIDDTGATSFAMSVGAILVDGQTVKHAIAYKPNDFQLSAFGLVSTVDTSGALPTVNQLAIGSRGGAANQMIGHIRRIKYFPYRLTAAQLQALTT